MRPIRAKEKIYCIVRDILGEYNCYYYQSPCYFMMNAIENLFSIQLMNLKYSKMFLFLLIRCSHSILKFIYLFK
jgi:hypothetical protein